MVGWGGKQKGYTFLFNNVRTVLVRGPRVAPDGGSAKLLLEKHQLVLLADPPLLAEQ